MIRGRGRRDQRLRNKPFLKKKSKNLSGLDLPATAVGEGVRIGGEGRRGGGGGGRGEAGRART